ncbi:hypothetical protein [Pseudanabaena sp. UWO310]|uniref:hypothetical protein n=1 Tax=Pseudanabaena sp. UWO310 TaxID=2480795 RepID=UPI0011591291|nr:hypothetical protein [Pseudanabaena sp. UWO310]TYQ30773.1 hypothetical protein PseudUWO310_06860 [Pseudanabaena sp. UWO310]
MSFAWEIKAQELSGGAPRRHSILGRFVLRQVTVAIFVILLYSKYGKASLGRISIFFGSRTKPKGFGNAFLLFWEILL